MYILGSVFFYALCSCVRSDIGLDLLKTAKNPFQFLEEQNYTYENHTITTEDCYKLLLVRIPYDRHESSSSNIYRPPVLFVHGILGSFSDFIVSGPGISLSFKAVERGYDVFFLNTRGNRWSRSHTTLDPDLDAKQYWNFSWHEVGIYDLPATIDYIINITGYSQISYVGHSQGTTEFLVMASSRPEYNEKITVAVLLAPVSYLGNAQYSLIKLLKNNVNFVEEVTKLMELNEIHPYTAHVSESLKVLCGPNSALLRICEEFFYKSTGPSAQINKDKSNVNKWWSPMISTNFMGVISLVSRHLTFSGLQRSLWFMGQTVASMTSAILTNFPAGASRRQFLHFLQNAHSGEFRLYDYGKKGNAAEYGQITPPDYNLWAVTAPVALFYGANDYVVALLDVARLAFNLPNVVANVGISLVQTNHLDVLVGTLAEELVNQPALNILNEYNDL